MNVKFVQYHKILLLLGEKIALKPEQAEASTLLLCTTS